MSENPIQPPAPRAHLGLRGQVAVAAGRSAALASRLLGKGSGGMIGGRVAQRICPDILARLAAGKNVAIVTGTNGKSTTTRMLTAAIEAGGHQVATNRGGDNMTGGLITALMSQRHAPYAVLEVDEMHVPGAAAQVRPRVLVYLNLSRDQLDRVGEITKIEGRLRQAVEENLQATVVANCDDPLVTSAAWEAAQPVWVAAGAGWTGDSLTSARTGGAIMRRGQHWWAAPLDGLFGEEEASGEMAETADDSTEETAGDSAQRPGSDRPAGDLPRGLQGFSRPTPQWTLALVEGEGTAEDPAADQDHTAAENKPTDLEIGTKAQVISSKLAVAHVPTQGADPLGGRAWAPGDPVLVRQAEAGEWTLRLALPGRANRGNAAQALAAAQVLGIEPSAAARGIESVKEVAGRYAMAQFGQAQLRVLLAKNPAGWQESLTMIDRQAGATVVAVNGQEADGVDLSWLWDVDFSRLSGHVVASGERGRDLQVRLQYAGLNCDFVADPLQAVATCPPGRVDLLANYTAFRDIRLALISKGVWK